MFNSFSIITLASGSIYLSIFAQNAAAFVTTSRTLIPPLCLHASSIPRTPKLIRFAINDLLPSMIATEQEIPVGQEAISTVVDEINGSSFTDEIMLFDPLIQKILIFFGFAVIVLIALSFLGQKMDSAIESVLIDFENTMKKYYASRWVDIDKELEGLDATERSVKLLEIMERLQEKEPQFMEKLNRKL